MKALIDAAVLVPLFRDANNELKLILVRRNNYGIHAGELALPGGKKDPSDKSLLDTALREAQEETGIIANTVTIIEQLPAVTITVSGFRVTPFLGIIVPPTHWQPEEKEIEEVIEVYLRDLNPETHTEEVMHHPQWPEPRNIPFYRIGEHKLWGATYRIIHPLLKRKTNQLSALDIASQHA